MNADTAATLRHLMTVPGHTPVEFNGRHTTAQLAIAAMLKGESAHIDVPQPERSGAALRPTEEALAALSPEARAALERGEGIPGMMASHQPTIRTRQDSGDHGTTQMRFHTDKDGNVQAGSAPAVDPEAKPIVRPAFETSTATRINMQHGEGRNPWSLLDR